MSNPMLPGVEDYDAIRTAVRRIRAHAVCPRRLRPDGSHSFSAAGCPCIDGENINCPEGYNQLPPPAPDPLVDVRAEIARRYGDFPWRR
jgi:hypothetical protein